MTCKIISLFNQAGGVGKTTITQNIGYHLAQNHQKVLLIDLDPQASLTSFMGLEPSEQEMTIYQPLVEEQEASLPIQTNLFGVDFVPSNLLLANAEQQLIFANLREFRLQQILEPIRPNYDFILIDCPPSLGLLSLIALVASDGVLVPIQTQFKATVGTDSLLQTVYKVRKQINSKLQIVGFIPTQYLRTNKTEQRVLELIEEQLSAVAPILTPLPRATAIAEATEYGMPFALTPKKNSAIVKLFTSYTQHLQDYWKNP
jgi:chromosome partitioning protein